MELPLGSIFFFNKTHYQIKRNIRTYYMYVHYVYAYVCEFIINKTVGNEQIETTTQVENEML